jgi:hypothetical protein
MAQEFSAAPGIAVTRQVLPEATRNAKEHDRN